MDVCHIKNSELEQKFQTHRERVVLGVYFVNDGSASYAVFTEQGFGCFTNNGRKSNGCHSKATRMRKTSS